MSMLLTLTCTRCNSEFKVCLDTYRTLNISDMPKRCPKCCDEIQERPDIVLNRNTIAEYVVKLDKSVVNLINNNAELFQPLPTDHPTHRLVLKGNQYGVCWSGRIDLYTYVWPLEENEIVTFSHNSVQRLVWYVESSKPISRMFVKNDGSVPRTIVTTRRVSKDYKPIEEESEVKQREEINEYVSISRTIDSTTAALQRDYLPILVWLEAYTKTTLKGLGRQIYSSIKGGIPIWFMEISGGVRSGRLGTHAMLAIGDPLDMPKVVTNDY